MNRICHIEIDDQGLPAPSPEMEQERRVAVYDLLEANNFVLPDRDGRAAPPGPYRLGLALRETRLLVDVAQEDGADGESAGAAVHRGTSSRLDR